MSLVPFHFLPPLSCVSVFRLQQAKEMVNEILRERDHSGFGDRNEFGSRMGGGGIDVIISNLKAKNLFFDTSDVIFDLRSLPSNPTDRRSSTVCGSCDWSQWGDDKEDPE